jgi:hypothetical protein
VINDAVIKSSSNKRFMGEVFFYEHIPVDIQHLFPKLIGVNHSKDPRLTTLRMERLHGVTCSYLLTALCLTPGRFNRVLTKLSEIHQSQGHPDCVSPDPKLVDVYANYVAKLKERYDTNRDLYASLGSVIKSEEIYRSIEDYLVDYTQQQRGVYARVIHGSPVFSNIMLTNDGKVKFFDMRGALGDRLTLEGDIMYDLAKIYLSLWGYDFVQINRFPLARQDVEMLAQLRDTFRTFVQSQYNVRQFRDIEMICASLIFSLIPLHPNSQHQSSFLRMCETIVFPFGVELE